MPAVADPRSDYDALIAEAQASISAAQEALTAAQEAYDKAVVEKHAVDLKVSDKLELLNNATQNKQVKQQAVQNAQEALDEAQLQYETALIPDPFWIHPTYQQEHTRQVSYTEMVPRIVTTERTITTTTGGLTAKVYNMAGYNNAPPLPGESRLVSTQTVSNINYDWGGGRILNTSLYEDAIVKFTGYITLPSNGTYTFYAPADDGVQLFIDGNQIINDWYDKGGGGTMVERYMTAGQHEITLWYYENGGGANVWLYWILPDGTFEVIPASAFGSNIVTETVYEQTTVYDEVTRYRNEIYYTTELVPNVSAPRVNDPELLVIVNEKQDSLDTAESDLEIATTNESEAQQTYDTSVSSQTEKAGIIEVASNDVINKQEKVYIAQQELEAIPPFREPTPTPETTTEPTSKSETPITTEIPESNTPTPISTTEDTPELPVDVATVDPQELTPAQVTELISVANEILANSEQGSPEYEQALEALFVAAEADDIQLDANLAAIPGLSAAVDAINFIGNVGADMSPKVREQSKKVVVASVVAVGSAVNAATTAAVSASAPSGGTSNIRRKQ